MSLGSTVRAMPTLLKVGFAEAVAYRAELLVWVLSTTMPLIMLALWSAVASEAPVGRFGQSEFTAYFLITFIVRQLTGAWAAWYMNYEVRTGALAMRLLRPVHPLLCYAAENLAALPLRLVIAVPVAALALAVVGAGMLPREGGLWVAAGASLFGSWLITFLANVIIGTLSLYLDSTIKLMDVWLAAYFVFSGYLVPIELFPHWLQVLAGCMPFRYQVGLPVELLTSQYALAGAWEMVAKQWGFVAVLLLFAGLLWQRGLRRFAAYGG